MANWMLAGWAVIMKTYLFYEPINVSRAQDESTNTNNCTIDSYFKIVFKA